MGAALYFLPIRAYAENSQIRNRVEMKKMNGNHGKYAGWTISSIAAASLAFSPILFPALAAKLTGNVAASADGPWDSYTPAGVDRKLAAKFNRLVAGRNAVVSKNSLFPFTPAGIDRGANRTMIIATRTDSPLSVNAISTRNLAAMNAPAKGKSVNLNESDFNLKANKGWQGFKLPASPRSAMKAPVADIAVAAGGFRLEDTAKPKNSRFKANVNVDQTREAAPSPRGNAAAGEYKVGLESSFSLSRRIDLTAGVRYSSERDRVAPTIDDRKDSEAVYVGTKIHF